MKTVRIILAVLLVALCSDGILAQDKPAAKPVKAVRFGKLWDAKGKLWTNAIVIVEGERIRAVTTDALAIPAGAETIDLSRYTGLPGLIDVHTHLTIYTDEIPGEPMLKQLNNPPAMEVFLARKGAMRTLEAGVTTVRDLGADQYMDIAMRDLINRGEMIGPRMFVVGYGLNITNTPYKPGVNPPAGGIADGVPEILRAVRQQIAAGADLIKMYASTGTDDDVTGFQTYNYEEIKAAVDARLNNNMVIIARSDALAVESFDATIERAQLYIEAGADVTFVEAPKSADEIRAIPQRLAVPQVVNVVVGGKTPVFGQEELATMRYGLVLYANVALQGAIAGMQAALKHLKATGRMDEASGMVATFAERQRLVKKPLFDELDRKYAERK